MLGHVEITGDFDFTYLERKKQDSAASKVQLEAQQAQVHVNTADSNIVHCCSQLEPAVVVPSLFTRVSAFFLSFSALSFSFCSICKLFICFYSTTPAPSPQGFMRMSWAQLLPSSFFFFFFFFFFDFHRSSLPKKGTCYHSIDDVRVRMCAEDGIKDSFFFCAKTLECWRTIATKMKENATRKMAPETILRLAQKRFFEPWLTFEKAPDGGVERFQKASGKCGSCA